jgi:hypothetical protein
MHEAHRVSVVIRQLVCGMQSGGRIEQQPDGHFPRDGQVPILGRPLQLRQRRAFHQVHDQVHDVVALDDVLHRHDVRVMQLGGEVRLVQ